MRVKRFVSMLILIFAMFLLTLNISANENDTKSESEISNKITNMPVASLSGPTVVYAGETNTWRVGTSSRYGPHTFYFNSGDGTAVQRFAAVGYETSKDFRYIYRWIGNSQRYTQTGRTIDQLSIMSMPAYKDVTVLNRY